MIACTIERIQHPNLLRKRGRIWEGRKDQHIRDERSNQLSAGEERDRRDSGDKVDKGEAGGVVQGGVEGEWDEWGGGRKGEIQWDIAGDRISWGKYSLSHHCLLRQWGLSWASWCFCFSQDQGCCWSGHHGSWHWFLFFSFSFSFSFSFPCWHISIYAWIGAIVGIAIGGFLGLLLLVALVFVLFVFRQAQKTKRIKKIVEEEMVWFLILLSFTLYLWLGRHSTSSPGFSLWD